MNRRIWSMAVLLAVTTLLVAGVLGWSGLQVATGTIAMPDHDDGTVVSGDIEGIGTDSQAAAVNVTYGGSSEDTVRWVVPTDDGGYALVGGTESFGTGEGDFWLVKVAADGTEEWNQTYGGGDNELAHAAVQTDDGGFLVSGTTESFGAGEGDFWLVKVATDGTEEWNQTYGGSGDDFWAEIAETADGNYILSGTTESFGAGASDFWLVKVAADGTEEWNQTYGGELSDPAFALDRTDDGGFVLAGNTFSFNPGGDRDAWLVKVAADGTEEWNQSYGRGATDIAFGVVQTTDGGYALTGTSEVSGLRAGWLRKVNATGAEEWSRSFGGESGATYDPSGLVQTNDGGYAFVMNTRTLDEETGWSNSTTSLVSVSDSGIEEGNLLFGGSGNDVLFRVHQNDDGSYALVGYTESAGAGGRDGWLLVVENQTVTESVNPLLGNRDA